MGESIDHHYTGQQVLDYLKKFKIANAIAMAYTEYHKLDGSAHHYLQNAFGIHLAQTGHSVVAPRMLELYGKPADLAMSEDNPPMEVASKTATVPDGNKQCDGGNQTSTSDIGTAQANVNIGTVQELATQHSDSPTDNSDGSPNKTDFTDGKNDVEPIQTSETEEIGNTA